MTLDDINIVTGLFVITVLFVLGLTVGIRLEMRIESWWNKRKRG